MVDESVLTFDKNLDSLNYNPSKDTNSKRTKSIKIDLKEQVHRIRNPLLALQDQGVEKIIIPSIIIDIYTRLEVLLRLKLSGHTDALTEASNLKDELYKRGEIPNKQQYRNALNKFSTQQMELPSKLIEQIAFNTRPKIEEHLSIVINKSTHEEHQSQPRQTNNKQFKIAVTFLNGFKGSFIVTNKKKQISIQEKQLPAEMVLSKSTYRKC